MAVNRIGMLFVMAMLAFAMPLRAQSVTLTGKITGKEGKPVAEATIAAAAGARIVAAATSGQNGEYSLTVPQAGNYIITVRRLGYARLTRDNLSIGTGGSTNIDFQLVESVSQLEAVVTAASRAPEKVIDAPASVSVVSSAAVQERAAVNVTDHVVALPGIDVARGGIARANTVARGFNNIFSGAMMTLTDHRFAFVPSLRVNIPYLSTTTNEDVDHIEVVLGPGAALYGPNTASGVMAITTKSPFASPGVTATIDGGNQNLIRGGVRGAWVVTPKIGVKASYDVFHGKEWDFLASDTVGENKARDRDVNRQGGEARIDFRPNAASEVIATYGRSEAGSAVEPTGLGPAQVKDWVYQTYQLRGRYKSLFAQVFMNTSDAGGSFLLTAVKPTTNCPDATDFACVIDKSRQLVGQVQHGFNIGTRQRFIYGYDYIRTTPRTEGTITGRNEEDDDITENGGYIHSVTDLTDKFQLTAAARLDKHSRLEDPVFSPRVALVFKPLENQNLRVTYNRAFSTPSTNNLFLDLLAGRIPTAGTQLYGVRALGVPSSGLTFSHSCTGGVNNLCMKVPQAFTGTATVQTLPANAALLYKAAVGAAASGLIARGVPQNIVTYLASLQPTAAEVGTRLRVLNSAAGTFTDVEPTDLRDVERLKPEIHNVFEGGYKGIIGRRLQLSLDVWHENRKNFVGPLIVETPNVFMDATTLGGFLAAKLAAIGVPPAQIQALAPTIAGALGGVSGDKVATGVPLGVVNFSENLSSGSDVILTYRNFGNLNLWGSDFGGEFLATDKFSVAGTYSWVNKNLFPRSEVGGVSDISLNAPSNKHSVTVRYRDDSRGWGAEIRERHVDAFEAAGFISAHIDNYTLLDAGVNWRPPMLDNVLIAVNGTNITNKKHQEFAQGNLIGRLIITRLQVTF
jgi:outer membrane receptor for ferrienterochelin and colicins